MMKENDGRGWFYWHWQNLTKDDLPKNSRKSKVFAKSGRAWFTFGDYSDYKQTEVKFEWYLLSRGLGCSFTFDSDPEETLKWNINVPGINLYLTIANRPIRDALKALKIPDGRFDIYFFQKAIWWQFWGSVWGDMSSSDPWWKKSYSFHFLDFLLGSTRFTESDLSDWNQHIVIDPIGTFKPYTKVVLRTWKRPRWFATKAIYTEINFEMPDKPPSFCGKGENSWDQDDDGIWGTSFKTADTKEAISMYVKRVEEMRARRGTPRSV